MRKALGNQIDTLIGYERAHLKVIWIQNVSDISQETTQRSTSNGEDALDFAGLKILRRTTAQMISSIDQTVAGQSRLDIAFCNANTLLRAVDNADYHQTLDKMTLINDGIGAD